MLVRQICDVNNTGILTIKIPEIFKEKKKLLVVIDDCISPDKIELMKKAAKDPLFLQDIEEVEKDFENTDKEL